MKAQDFIKTYEKISDDNRHSTFFKSRTMFEFAEDYHQAKLNLLTIPIVIVSDFCKCNGVQDLHAMTGECRKCGKECDY